jgi:hypothetical protein
VSTDLTKSFLDSVRDCRSLRSARAHRGADARGNKLSRRSSAIDPTHTWHCFALTISGAASFAAREADWTWTSDGGTDVTARRARASVAFPTFASLCGTRFCERAPTSPLWGECHQRVYSTSPRRHKGGDARLRGLMPSPPLCLPTRMRAHFKEVAALAARHSASKTRVLMARQRGARRRARFRASVRRAHLKGVAALAARFARQRGVGNKGTLASLSFSAIWL